MNSDLDNAIKTGYEKANNNKFHSFINAIMFNVAIIILTYLSTKSTIVAILCAGIYSLGLICNFLLNTENYKSHLKHTYALYKIPFELLWQCILYYMIFKLNFHPIIIALIVFDTLFYIKGLILFMKMKLCRELE